MVMHTNSGIIAMGADGSKMRILYELRNAIENQFEILFLTEEGRIALKSFYRACGCDADIVMLEVNRSEAVRQLHMDEKATLMYFCGIRDALNHALMQSKQ